VPLRVFVSLRAESFLGEVKSSGCKEGDLLLPGDSQEEDSERGLMYKSLLVDDSYNSDILDSSFSIQSFFSASVGAVKTQEPLCVINAN